MRTPYLLCAAVIAITGGASSSAWAQGGSPFPSVTLVNANVVDVKAGRIVANATVVVRDGRISSVAPGAAAPGSQVIDLRGKYVIPGLIDAHTHLAGLRAAQAALHSGVTTVRSSSVGSFRDVALRDLVKSGAVPGPDVLAAGIFVSPRLGEDDILADPRLVPLSRTEIREPERLRQLVAINLDHGVDWIKTRGTERAGLAETDPREQTYDEAQLRAVVEEAATRNVPVQAHAHGDEGAMAAVKAGVRSIEHGTYLSDATLRLMKEKGTFLVPTYATVVDLAEPGGDYDSPALHLRGMHMLPRLKDTVSRAHAMGIPIATGADTSYGPNSVTRIAHEVLALSEMGLSRAEALRSATITAARLLRREAAIGSIESGFEADLVVIEANPLEDLRGLQDPLLVMSNGFVAVNRLSFAKR